jgi:hypothetical protein
MHSFKIVVKNGQLTNLIIEFFNLLQQYGIITTIHVLSHFLPLGSV